MKKGSRKAKMWEDLAVVGRTKMSERTVGVRLTEEQDAALDRLETRFQGLQRSQILRLAVQRMLVEEGLL